MWEGLICFGAQLLVGVVERREMKLFRIFWLRAVLGQFIFGKTHTSPEVAPLDDRLPMRAILKSAQILKPNDLKIEDLCRHLHLICILNAF